MRDIKREKCSLPGEMRRLKTPLINLLIAIPEILFVQ